MLEKFLPTQSIKLTCVQNAYDSHILVKGNSFNSIWKKTLSDLILCEGYIFFQIGLEEFLSTQSIKLTRVQNCICFSHAGWRKFFQPNLKENFVRSDIVWVINFLPNWVERIFSNSIYQTYMCSKCRWFSHNGWRKFFQPNLKENFIRSELYKHPYKNFHNPDLQYHTLF